MIENFNVKLQLGSRRFNFPLCAKKERFGDAHVDHVWMDVRSLYGQRQRSDTLCRDVANYFWETCKLHGADADPDNQEIYILTRLLGAVRSNAARAIFCDARLLINRREHERILEAINGLLRKNTNRLNPIDFNEKTADMLGPEVMSESEQAEYVRFARELFGDSREVCRSDPDAAVAAVTKRWTEATEKWGRRAGFREEKKILNIISYECRAALHRCYSVVWEDLLSELARKRKLNKPSACFLRLWHLEKLIHGQSLFHGHVFGLHPGCSLLLQSNSGRQILGKWLADPESEDRLFALLNAIFVCAYCYTTQRLDYAAQRKRQPRYVADLNEIQNRELKRKQGDTRIRPRSTDPNDKYK